MVKQNQNIKIGKKQSSIWCSSILHFLLDNILKILHSKKNTKKNYQLIQEIQQVIWIKQNQNIKIGQKTKQHMMQWSILHFLLDNILKILHSKKNTKKNYQLIQEIQQVQERPKEKYWFSAQVRVLSISIK